MLVVVGCLLFVVCCLPLPFAVVCGLSLCVVCCVLLAPCSSLMVVVRHWLLFFVFWCLVFGVLCLLFVCSLVEVRCLLFVVC